MSRHTYIIKRSIVIFNILWISCSLSAQKIITTETLLQEMTDRNRLPEYPDPYYSSKQFSSYDRSSKTPDTPEWFANRDYNQFIREENNNGRREFVLFDAQSPGAIVRFWSTIADYKGKGTLRFYIDGNPVPQIEGEIISILSKNALTQYPLAASVSKKAIDLYQAYNFYFPVAYAKSCKITYESDAIHKGEILYYNIGYREYEPDTQMQSFQKSDLKTFAEQIKTANEKLANYNREIPQKNKIKKYPAQTLTPDNKFTSKLKGKSAIQKIEIKLTANNYEQALRSTVLKISFDGKETVWAPVGDFFGTGYKLSPYRSWYTEVSPDSTLSCYWIMPFKKECEVTIENFGKENIKISHINIITSPWKWNEQTMYFGAGWYEKYKMHTRRNGERFDLNLVELKGEGVLVGTGLTVFDAIGIWWGEGDERVYVDGEKFPSTFGTGSEDFFGYAWCRLEDFEHPFVCQPRGDGNNSKGMTSNVRFRSLDGIPFKKELTFDLEMWHWADTKINYAPLSYYYQKENGTSNLGPQPEAVKEPVALKPEDVVNNHVGTDGFVEIELLDRNCSSGIIIPQSIGYIFSYNQQAWWKEANPGSKAEFTFISDYEGIYNAKIRLTQANDYSQIRIYLNGKMCLENFDGYNPEVNLKWVELGQLPLLKGKNRITVEITGKNPLAKGDKNMCGLDCLVFDINK